MEEDGHRRAPFGHRGRLVEVEGARRQGTRTVGHGPLRATEGRGPAPGGAHRHPEDQPKQATDPQPGGGTPVASGPPHHRYPAR